MPPATCHRRSPSGLAALGLAALLAGPAPGQDRPADKYALDPDRFHFGRVEDDAPVRGEADNPDEFLAYNEALLHARRFPAAELEQHARRDVLFADLVKPVRQDFRLKLVYFEGRLKRLRRLDPTRPLAAAGVADLYEAWLFPRSGPDPVCVLSTELPPGLEPGLDYSPPVPAAAAGYSFKLIHYEAAELNPKDRTRHRVRKAPLLMAHSLTLRPAAVAGADGGDPWRTGFLPGLGAVLGGLAAAALALTAWFRRGDRAVRRELDNRRDVNPFAGP
jgi:hypothetical protein